MGEAITSKPRAGIESLSSLVSRAVPSTGAVPLVSSPGANETTVHRDLAACSFKFVALIHAWPSRARTMPVPPMEADTTQIPKIDLLSMVSLETLPFDVLGSGKCSAPPAAPLSETATSVRGFTGGTVLVPWGFSPALAGVEKRSGPRGVINGLRSEASPNFVSSGFFSASAHRLFGRIDLGWLRGTEVPLRIVMSLGAAILANARRFGRGGLGHEGDDCLANNAHSLVALGGTGK